MLTDAFGTGSHTTPNDACSDSSGFSAALPPNSTPTCVLQSRPVSCVTGQRTGSVSPVCVTPPNCGVNSSYRLGARKPVPYEPRNSTSRVGCQRRLNFGFVVLPKSL